MSILTPEQREAHLKDIAVTSRKGFGLYLILLAACVAQLTGVYLAWDLLKANGMIMIVSLFAIALVCFLYVINHLERGTKNLWPESFKRIKVALSASTTRRS